MGGQLRADLAGGPARSATPRGPSRTRLPIEKLHPRVLPQTLAILDLRKPSVPYDRSGVRILDRLQRQMPNCRVLFDAPQMMALPSVPWSNPINQ